jgi:hypothetical protein
MKQSTKRFWAREIVWLLYTIGAIGLYMAIQYFILYNVKPDESRIKGQEYTFYILMVYGIFAYPVRYLVYLSKWAFTVLANKETT